MKNAVGTFLRENATANKRGATGTAVAPAQIGTGAVVVGSAQESAGAPDPAEAVMDLVKLQHRIEASDIVKTLGLPLGVTLGVLEQLERFGMVTVDRSGPQTVIAVPD